MSARALLILSWIRSLSRENQFDAGYTMGYFRATEHFLEGWERCYLNNVLKARERGISA